MGTLKGISAVAVLALGMLAFAAPAWAQDPEFGTKRTFDVGNEPFSVEKADLDGDGDLDLATANYGSDDASVLLNDGAGGFRETRHAVEQLPDDIALADADRDGDPDLIVASLGSSSGKISVLRNDGRGGFGLPPHVPRDWPGASQPTGVAAADLDRDGDNDLAVSDRAWGRARVFWNRDNFFSLPDNYDVGRSGTPLPEGIAVADVDGRDGPDIVVPSRYDNSVTVFKNNGSGNFGAQGARSDYPVGTDKVGTGPWNVVAADLDGDDDPDLAAASGYGRYVSVLENDGAGNFGAAAYHPGGQDVTAADLDGDGDLDLATPHGPGSTTVSVLRNDGSGGFEAAGNFSAGDGPSGIASGDFDGDGDSDLVTADTYSDTVSVRLNGPATNTPPMAHEQRVRTREETPVNITLSASDEEGGELTYELRSLPLSGTLYRGDSTAEADRISAPGPLNSTRLTYKPNPNFWSGIGPNPSDSFLFRASDGSATSAQATVGIDVAAVNDPPSFNLSENPDQTVDEDSGRQTVQNFATDISVGPAETIQWVNFEVTSDNPSLFARGEFFSPGGRPAISGDGTLTFTPAADANGSATVTVVARDSGGTADGGQDSSAPRTFSITVRPANDAPLATNDSGFVTGAGEPLEIPASDLLANDRPGPPDEAGQTISVTGVENASTGQVALRDGRITFTPDGEGRASFGYTVCDDGVTLGAADPKCAKATVNVTATRTNAAPRATDGSYEIDEDSGPLDINLGDLVSDRETADADLYYFLPDPDPAQGTLTGDNQNPRFEPAPDFHGTVELSYTVFDGGVPYGCEWWVDPECLPEQSAEARITVTVRPVNDRPVAGDDDSYAVDENDVLTVGANGGLLANDRDPDGDPLAAALVAGPAHGTLSLQPDGSFIYTPKANYSGADSFTYKANDGISDSEVAEVRITVSAANDNPATGDDRYAANEDETLTVGPAEGVLGNDRDPEGDPLTAALKTGPRHGEVNLNPDGSFTYAPNRDFDGDDSFVYTVSDGRGGSADGTATIRTSAVNDDPAVSALGDRTTDEDTPTGPLAFTVADVDDAPGGLTVSASSDDQGLVPDAGIALGGAGPDRTVEVTPAPDANSGAGLGRVANITLRIEDGRGGASSTRFPVAVRPVNDAPVTAGDDYATDEDVALGIGQARGVLANDADPDGDPLTASIKTAPQHGTLSLDPDGSFSYVPDKDFGGTDSFVYAAEDGAGGARGATTTTIRVSPVDDPPVARDDSYAVAEDTPLVVRAPGVLQNDSDADGETPTATRLSDPRHGKLSLQPDGFFLYVPDKDFEGEDSFTYKATDGKAESDVATVRITVSPAAEPPAPNTAPTITALTPGAGTSVRDRTPTIGATVTDGETELARNNIRLWVDGRRIENFSYDATSDRLAYAAGKLGPGRYPVLIVARDDERLLASRFWAFRVVGR